jgi:hypothetical protein
MLIKVNEGLLINTNHMTHIEVSTLNANIMDINFVSRASCSVTKVEYQKLIKQIKFTELNKGDSNE